MLQKAHFAYDNWNLFQILINVFKSFEIIRIFKF